MKLFKLNNWLLPPIHYICIYTYIGLCTNISREQYIWTKKCNESQTQNQILIQKCENLNTILKEYYIYTHKYKYVYTYTYKYTYTYR